MATPDLENPFSEAQHQEMKEGLVLADRAIAAARRGIQAGIATEAQLELLQEDRQRLLRIVTTYFPNG